MITVKDVWLLFKVCSMQLAFGTGVIIGTFGIIAAILGLTIWWSVFIAIGALCILLASSLQVSLADEITKTIGRLDDEGE